MIGPFNQDIYLQRLAVSAKELGAVNAVETGTYHGHTTKYLASVFDHVTSIEVNRRFLLKAQRGLRGTPNVKLLWGSSKTALDTVLMGLTGRTFVFLDAHWQKYCPIGDELQALQTHAERLDPIIMIHDFQNPHRLEFGYDEVNGGPLNWDRYGEAICAVYGGRCEAFYNDKACGSLRGVVVAGRGIESLAEEYGVGFNRFV